MTGCLKRHSHDAIGNEDPSFGREGARPSAVGAPLSLVRSLSQKPSAHGLPLSRDRPRAVVLALSLGVRLQDFGP